MNKSTVIHLVCYAGMAVMVALALKSFHEESVNAATAKAKNELLERDNASLEKEKDQAKADIATAENKRVAAEAEIEKWKNKPATVASVRAHNDTALGPAAVEQCTDASGKTAETLVIQGDAKQNLQAAQNAEADMASCKLDLKACMDKMSASLKLEGLTEQQKANLTTEKGNLQTVINGGTWKHRALQAGKCVLTVGAASGGGAVIASKMKIAPWKGATIGGVAGEVGCRLFF